MAIFVIHTADGVFERVQADACRTEDGQLVVYFGGKPVAHYDSKKIIAVHREEIPALIHLKEDLQPAHPPGQYLSSDDSPSAA